MSGARRLIGAVSWESLAKAAMRTSDPTLSDATVRATEVRLGDGLLGHITTIIDKGFVFVVAEDQTICGIVTTADLSTQFSMLANPFFLIGEIEGHLRAILNACFTADELAGVRNPGEPSRSLESAENMSIGEFQRLLEKPANWDRLRWPVDRVGFVRALDDVREIRNDVMHFNPDPLDAEQLTTLQNFVTSLEMLSPRSQA